MDSRVLTRVDVAATLPETARLDALQPRLDQLFTLTERAVEESPAIRNLVAAGMATFATSQFVLEGKSIRSAVFAASFKRCGLLWKLLLKELEALSCPQRLLLKLQYCQKLCIHTFDICPLDTKRSMVSDNVASVNFALELSAAIIQGFLPAEPSQMAATMVSFFQQFQQYIPCDVVPLHPSHCQRVLAKLIVISEPNKCQEAALELVITTVLHSVSYYGWHATIGDVNIETLLMVAVHSQSEKLSITTKALLAFMPGTLGVEVLLDREQLCLIVRQLSIAAATSESRSKEFSVREIIAITKAVTRISDNCSGLLEQGLEETLDALMEQGDETANAVAAEITWRVAAASGGADMEEEPTERCSTERTLNSKWGYASPQTEDPDGTIVFTDILLHQLAQLVFEKSPDDLSAEEALTMETLVFTVFDIYWQSEAKMKCAISELFGDKYIKCLIDLNEILHDSYALKAVIVANMGYSMLIQDMARNSAYFCEKSGAGGFIGVMLCTVRSYMNKLVRRVNQTMLDYRLMVLFYCAHIKMFHYSEFGIMSALNTLNCVLESSAARTRLLTRLVICCLHPIMEDHHMGLLTITEEESQLLLTYIRDTKLPGGLDRKKFLMAVSVLYRDFSPQNAFGPVAGIVAETVVKQILQDCDNRILESALCLLWTLSRISGMVQVITQSSHLVPALRQMLQTSILAVSLLAKAVLWQLGYGNYEDHAERYHCASTCLQYGFYTECIDQCDRIIAAPTSSLHGVARQVRGKAYAHLHQNQFWHIMKQAKLDVAVPWKRGDFVDQCATKAKKAVQDLGFALDNGVLDEEGSCLMDVAMLHFVRIKHQLRDCNRCLLCRRRGMKLKESHTCPRFLLKEYSKAGKKGLQQLGITDEFDSLSFHSIGGSFAAYTPNTMTYAMLCGRCEQCLSQNGEDQFRKDILPLIYNGTDEIQTVKYTSNIYSFCLGVVFRSFVHNVFTVYCNASEIHSLFAACRHHLLSLPVKHSDVEDVPDPPSVPEVMSMTKTEAFLFASPYKMHIENSQLILLSASMSSNCGLWYLTTPLSTEPKSKVNFCHALVARLTCCSIIVPFSPSQGGSLDTRFRINTSGGDYQVLPDVSRWKTIPNGLLQVFVDLAVIFAKQYQQVLYGMKTTKKDSKKADAFIESLISLPKMIGFSEQPITASSLQSIPPKEAELITTFLSKTLVVVKMLPEGFDFCAVPPQVILKEGYMLLYHIHNEQQGATFFFASNPEGIAFGKLIVIMKFTEENESFERVEGYNVHIQEDGSSCSICVTGNLLVPATEKLQETQRLRHRTASERIKKAVNILLQRCGSPKVFLHHARLQMRLKDNPCLDHRCSSTGCWYCKDRCHICMDLANQGYTLFPSNELMFKHCSEQCKAIVEEVPRFSVEFHPALLLKHRGKRAVVLASIKGCLASVMSTHTIVQVSIYISIERTSIAYGRPLAVVQLRTQDQHTFFSVYLSDDFSPTEPVSCFPASFTFQMLKDSDILTQTFQMSLSPLEVFSISQLLGSGSATGPDSTLAKAFCLSSSPCTSKLPWKNILVSFESKISREELVSKWIVEQLMLACDHGKTLLELQSSEDLSQGSIILLPSVNACTTMFWAYLQLTCLLWKRVLNKYSLSVEKLMYTTLITVKLYEQSPSDVQSYIISKFCSSAHILLLCGKISVVVIKGGLPLNVHQSAVEFLLLAHKLIATVNNASGRKSVCVRHLCQELEGVKQNDVQKTSKVSAVAQQWLLTLTLKSLSCNVTSVEAVPILLNSIQTFLKSPLIGIAVMAKAIAVILLQHSHQVGLTVSDLEMTDREVNFLTEIIHDLTEDDLKRRYYLHCVLQVLTLLCSQPINASHFASHNILSELETLMGCAREHEDIIANVLWRIATGGGGENSMEVTDKTLSGEIPDSEVDISLEVEQGLCYTVDKLLMIIHEFCSIYLECKHIPESHGCTVSSVAQLLCDLHQVMERREKEEVAESVAQHTAILAVLGLTISKQRESWLHIHNGICARSAIESLLITWTGCSNVISQAVVGVGVLTAIANSLHWALDCTALTAHDIEDLQNQVLIIYNVARKCPKQTAIQLQLSALQPLLHCSSLPVRVLSKSIVALIANYRDVSDITHLSLENDEAMFFSDCFGGSINFGSASVSGFNFSGEELLYSLKCLTSLPSNKTCFAVPDMLDTVLTLCLHDDKTIAKLALEVLWNISMEPTVGLAILCHESVIDTLKRMSVFTCGLASLTRNILWILGYGDVNDTTHCSEYAVACYHHRKYTEAVTWCNHVINMVDAAHHESSAVKSCKGKALAQIYLHKQNQQLQRSDQWAMLGYDSNSVLTELSTQQNLGLHPSAGSNKILSQLCLADLENWKNVCSQGRQAIQLLGELLDSDELDEEGSELLDWVMMDYYRETGETNDCNRCLLCRGTGELVFVAPKPTAAEAENATSDCNILSLHSFMYIEGSQSIFMFCKECEFLLSHYSEQHLEFILKATQKQPTTYGREVYLAVIAKLARALPMAYAGYVSNQRDVYNTFVACRQILLSHDSYTSTITFPKIHLFNNPKAWYTFDRQSFELNQLSKNDNAVIASKCTIDERGDPQETQYLMMHTGGWNLVVDLGSGKAENDSLNSQSLVHTDGGSFSIPSVSEQWETFPPELLQAFYDLELADKRRVVFQYIIRSEGKELSSQPSPRLFSKSARFWLPHKQFISFLPGGFSMEVDSDVIRSISLPEGHKILHHHHDHDKDLTVFLAYATNSMFQEKQFYFIFTCRLCNYFIADAIFLNEEAKEPFPFSNAVLFHLKSSLAIGEVTMVRQLLMQKFSPISCVLKSLMSIIITKYGDIGLNLKGVATYEDITRNCNLAVSVDTRCSPEGCWYCHSRCHSCLKPAAIGYTWRDSKSGRLLCHCSERCYYMHTADIPESTLLYVKLGEIRPQPGSGAHLLISATVLLHTGLSENTLISTQVAISYGCKEIPSGVVYAHTQLCTTKYRTPLLAFFVQHDLSPAKYVWDVTEFQSAELANMLREIASIKKSLQPVFEIYGCDDLPSFLEKYFPLLDVSFMNTNGTIYSWPPMSRQGSQNTTSADGLMRQRGDGDPAPNENNIKM